MISTLIASLLKDSFIFNKTINSPGESFLLSYVTSKIASFFLVLEKLLNKKVLLKLNIKRISIFVFIISLPLVFNSQVQLSALSSSRIDLSQRQFGIIFFSISNLFLIPILFITLRELKKNSLKFSSLEIILFLYLLISLFSAIFSVNFQSSFVWLLKLVYSFLIYFIFSRLALKKTEFKLILIAFALIALGESVIALLQTISSSNLGIFPASVERFESASLDIAIPFMSSNYFRAIGTFSHPNNLSNYLAIILPIICFGALREKGKIKYLYYCAVISCGVGIGLSLSRWGIVTGFFSVFLSIVLFWKFKKTLNHSNKYLTRLVLFFLVLVFAWILTNQALIRRFFSLTINDGSLLTRIELNNQALYMIKNNPLLGVGSGAFIYFFVNEDVTLYETSRSFLAPVHNFYLLIASETGLLSLFLILFFFVILIYYCFKKIPDLDRDKMFIGLGLLGSIITFLFNGLATMTSLTDRTGFLLSLLIGLLINTLSHSPVPKLSKSPH